MFSQIFLKIQRICFVNLLPLNCSSCDLFTITTWYPRFWQSDLFQNMNTIFFNFPSFCQHGFSGEIQYNSYPCFSIDKVLLLFIALFQHFLSLIIYSLNMICLVLEVLEFVFLCSHSFLHLRFTICH